jgi:hypothetical protein
MRLRNPSVENVLPVNYLFAGNAFRVATTAKLARIGKSVAFGRLVSFVSSFLSLLETVSYLASSLYVLTL